MSGAVVVLDAVTGGSAVPVAPLHAASGTIEAANRKANEVERSDRRNMVGVTSEDQSDTVSAVWKMIR
ncbi:MAG TPA: hypothetical protein VGH87_28250, partial [Polyangiaceae bacterium]